MNDMCFHESVFYPDWKRQKRIQNSWVGPQFHMVECAVCKAKIELRIA